MRGGSKIHIQYGIESPARSATERRVTPETPIMTLKCLFEDCQVRTSRSQHGLCRLQPLQEPTCPKLDNYPYTRFPQVTPSASRIQTISCRLTLDTFLSFLASLASKISTLHPSEEWMQWLQDPNFPPATFYIILTALICLEQYIGKPKR